MDAIAYQGVVQIIRKYKGRYRDTLRFHNNGTSHLFELLRDFLFGGSANEEVIPQYLDVGYLDSDGVWNSILTTKVRVATKTRLITDGGAPALQLRWQLNAALILKEGAGEGSTIRLRTYHDYDTNPLTEVDLGLTEYTMSTGESHEIYWTMYFTNPQSSSSESTTPDEASPEDAGSEDTSAESNTSDSVEEEGTV